MQVSRGWFMSILCASLLLGCSAKRAISRSPDGRFTIMRHVTGGSFGATVGYRTYFLVVDNHMPFWNSHQGIAWAIGLPRAEVRWISKTAVEVDLYLQNGEYLEGDNSDREYHGLEIKVCERVEDESAVHSLKFM